MKLFLDSANLDEIEAVLQRGCIKGITTNPSIIAREKAIPYKEHVKTIIKLLIKYNYNIPLSVEVTSTNPNEMVLEAMEFQSQLRYNQLFVKVPISWDNLQVIRELTRLNMRVNCTCCMSYNQAIMAANAGARYVSIFWGRIRDTGYDAASIVTRIRHTFKEWDCPTQIIVGSIRQMIDINEAFQAGANIVTAPAKFLPMMCEHPKTDEAVGQFVKDFLGWKA